MRKTLLNIFFLVLLAVGVFFSKQSFSILPYPMPVFIGILSVLFIMIGFKIVDFSIDAHLLSDKLDKKSNRLIRDILKVAVFIVCAIIFMKYGLELDLLSILTHSAILTAIIGLALQDTLSNVISGIIIQMEKPFMIGDWVEIDGLRGRVAETNWRYTKIRSWEDYFVHIPNNKVSSNILTNLSRPTKSVVRKLEIGVSYETPPLKVKKAIMEVLERTAKVMKNPQPKVRLAGYGDSSIKYFILFSISDFSDFRDIEDEVLSGIWYQFKRFNIEIPFPIRTLINKDVVMEKEKKSSRYAEIRELMKNLELFRDVEDKNLDLMIEFSHIDTYFSNSVICRENEPGSTMFFIIDGEIEIFKSSEKIASLSKGEFFGELSLLTNERRSATVKVCNTAKLMEIDREGFSVLVEKEPKLINHIKDLFDKRVVTAKKIGNSNESNLMKKNLFFKFKKLFGIK